MTFDKYYFENFSVDTPFDSSNPRYVMAMDGVDEVLTKVVKAEPYTLSKEQFEDQRLVKALLHVDVLQEKHGKLGLAVPIFVEKETAILQDLSADVAESISRILVDNRDKIDHIICKVQNDYSEERNLYHLLCGSIFDGMIFDFLEETDLVTTSKIHKTGLNYLVVLYQQSELLESYSNRLLCSYNRLIQNGSGFVSFGDSDGDRKDFYRYFRLKELGRLSEEEEAYVDYEPDELVQEFLHLLEGEVPEEAYLRVFEYFGYIENDQPCIPVYDKSVNSIVEELYHFVLELIREPLTEALSKIENRADLLSVAHGVPVKDIANEIYHLIFGEVNELLVKESLVAKPEYHEGEGRYFKSFER